MKGKLFIFDSTKKLAKTVGNELSDLSHNGLKSKGTFNIALAGGKTPGNIYQYLAKPDIQKTICWDNIRLFWGDERCVPPNHKESNYGFSKNAFISQVPISPRNVHRIYGENEPAREIIRYSQEIQKYLVVEQNALPRFDWILLGIGQDGHTASIFPNSTLIPDNSGICAISKDPQTLQKRITLTLKMLNSAKKISFIAIGEEKAQVVADILTESSKSKVYPASRVGPLSTPVEWYLDKDAAKYLNAYN